ncbi:MAG: hypothetical protein ACK2U6_06670, partial [Candidatus Promineifilaceae bacterium]
MPNRNHFPLTEPPWTEGLALVIAAIVLVTALFVLVSGPMLLSLFGGGMQLPALFSNAAPQPRTAVFEGTGQYVDERYIAQPKVPEASVAPYPRVAVFEGTGQPADERFVAQPDVPAASVKLHPLAAVFEGTNQQADERYIAQPE